MQVRKLTKKERFEGRLLFSVAFHDRIEDVDKAKKESKKETEEDWGAFTDDGMLMARIINNHFMSHFDGNLISNGGIGAVSTYPEYRGTGAIREIFNVLLPQAYENGEIISTLYPFNHAFYRKVGYETICWRNDYSFSPKVLKNYRFDGDAILWKPGDDVAEFTKLYNQFASNYNLAIERTDETMLRAHVKGEYYKDGKFCYLLKENGKAIAYVIYQDQKGDPAATLAVQDIAWINKNGFLAILGFLARFSADYGKITLFLPSDMELYSLIQTPDAYGITKQGTQAYMARVINAEKLLQLLHKPEGCSFTICVEDDLISANNQTWRVTDREALITDESPDLIVSEGALAQLALGSVSLNEASYRNDVEICANQEILRKIFVRKPIIVEDHF